MISTKSTKFENPLTHQLSPQCQCPCRFLQAPPEEVTHDTRHLPLVWTPLGRRSSVGPWSTLQIRHPGGMKTKHQEVISGNFWEIQQCILNYTRVKSFLNMQLKMKIFLATSPSWMSIGCLSRIFLEIVRVIAGLHWTRKISDNNIAA